MFNIRNIQEQVIYNAVSQASDARTAEAVIYGTTGEAKSESDSAWVKSTMARLEERFPAATVHEIRRNCQCGYGMDEKLTLLQELIAASTSLEMFGTLEKANQAGITYENGKLYLQFPYCPCPMLAEVDRLETDTWCQCTTGYSKVLFEQAFGCTVEVELLQSVKMGDPKCLMEIIPQGSCFGETVDK